MKAYLDLLRHVVETGTPHNDRTGVGTTCVFGYQMRHNLTNGFPLLTTKKIFWKGVIVELLWFLRGDTSVGFLQRHGVHIWDEWAKENGSLGPIYGAQWRRWRGYAFTVDQIAQAELALKQSPDSRRICVSAWNPADLPMMAMPPCHPFWQVRVIDGALHLHMTMRSTDAFLGLPFNFASYAALLSILARRAGLSVGELVVSFGDLHVYNNHREQVAEQLSRAPKQLPWLHIEEAVKDLPLDQLEPHHFEILSYDPHPAIKAEVAA